MPAVETLRVNVARVVGDHSLWVEFNNGAAGRVDVSSLLHGAVFEPLRDPAYFAKMTLDPVSGTVTWPNGADLAPEALCDLGLSAE